MNTLAQAYAADGQVTKAITLQQRVLVLQSDDAFARRKLARYPAQADDKRQAKTERAGWPRWATVLPRRTKWRTCSRAWAGVDPNPPQPAAQPSS